MSIWNFYVVLKFILLTQRYINRVGKDPKPIYFLKSFTFEKSQFL